MDQREFPLGAGIYFATRASPPGCPGSDGVPSAPRAATAAAACIWLRRLDVADRIKSRPYPRIPGAGTVLTVAAFLAENHELHEETFLTLG